jgi:hypothetical protein
MWPPSWAEDERTVQVAVRLQRVEPSFATCDTTTCSRSRRLLGGPRRDGGRHCGLAHHRRDPRIIVGQIDAADVMDVERERPRLELLLRDAGLDRAQQLDMLPIPSGRVLRGPVPSIAAVSTTARPSARTSNL